MPTQAFQTLPFISAFGRIALLVEFVDRVPELWKEVLALPPNQVISGPSLETHRTVADFSDHEVDVCYVELLDSLIVPHHGLQERSRVVVTIRSEQLGQGEGAFLQLVREGFPESFCPSLCLEVPG
jgi:hypothetical protein